MCGPTELKFKGWLIVLTEHSLLNAQRIVINQKWLNFKIRV